MVDLWCLWLEVDDFIKLDLFFFKRIRPYIIKLGLFLFGLKCPGLLFQLKEKCPVS